MASADHTNTIIIGAGAAGLSCAVCLQRSGIDNIVLEESQGIGTTWQKRYSRLHLHTIRQHSQLPYFNMPQYYPRYVSKDLYASYLRDYAASFKIHSHFNEKVTAIERGNDGWVTRSHAGTYSSQHIIIATGYAGKPVYDHVNGLRLFRGDILHSCDYTNGKQYANKKVLVIGFGNSACEIALCLYEHGAVPSLSVRGCVNILPREIAGVSVVTIARMQKWLMNLSPALADIAGKPVLAMINGNIKKYGLNKCSYGPYTQIATRGKIPLIDIGTMDLIKRGKVTVFPAIREIAGHSVVFSDGKEEQFDAIICATGYAPAFREFLAEHEKVCNDKGMPYVSGQESALPGLYFCGFRVSPTGMLREIGIEAKRIATQIKVASDVGQRLKLMNSTTGN